MLKKKKGKPAVDILSKLFEELLSKGDIRHEREVNRDISFNDMLLSKNLEQYREFVSNTLILKNIESDDFDE